MTWDELILNRDRITRIEITDWLHNTLYQYSPNEISQAREVYEELLADQDVSFYAYIGREKCYLDKE